MTWIRNDYTAQRFLSSRVSEEQGKRKLTLPPSGSQRYWCLLWTCRFYPETSGAGEYVIVRCTLCSCCALGNLLKSRTKQALTLSTTGFCVWVTRRSPSVCLLPWEMGWCQHSDGPIPSISVRSGAWLMDRKYSQRNNNICRIYFRNIRPLSPTFLISANGNGALILIYGRVYLFAEALAVRVALT